MQELFLDTNAHQPINQNALKAYSEFSMSTAGHGHPSALSLPGRLASSAIEEARSKIAVLIGAKSASQIVFTSGCTQACEWGLELLKGFPTKNGLQEYYVSPVEHPAISDPLSRFLDKKYLPINDQGSIVYSNIPTKNTSVTRKTICIHLQNEIGTIYDLNAIDTDYLLSDMSQSLGKIPINLSELNVDIAVFAGHKVAGPGGIGFIYLKNTNWYKEFGTGSRYFMDRPGTPDVAGVVATAVALEESLLNLPERYMNCTKFKYIIEKGFEQRGIQIIAQHSNRSPNTTFINMPGKAGSMLLNLSQEGIYVGLGSACGSMHAGLSQTLRALNLQGTSHDYMRISQYGYYGEKEAQYFLNVFDRCYAKS